MKSTLVTVALAAVVALAGCNNGTTGGPGADKARKKENESKLKNAEDKIIQPADTFNLKPPSSATIKQGDTKTVTVGISRGKNFDEDVVLKLDGLPKGVTVEPTEGAIKHGEKEAKLTFKAAADAALGTFTIKVIGHPTKGGDATNELKLTVEKS